MKFVKNLKVVDKWKTKIIQEIWKLLIYRYITEKKWSQTLLAIYFIQVEPMSVYNKNVFRRRHEKRGRAVDGVGRVAADHAHAPAARHDAGQPPARPAAHAHLAGRRRLLVTQRQW